MLLYITHQDDVMMERTAATVARLHAVPIPDSLQTTQPNVWTKIRQFLNSVTGDYTDLNKTKRSVIPTLVFVIDKCVYTVKPLKKGHLKGAIACVLDFNVYTLCIL